MEIIIDDSMVEEDVEAVIASARTCSTGEGKMFVPSLEEAIRIRTGEIVSGAV